MRVVISAVVPILLALCGSVASAQSLPVLVVNTFTTGADVVAPYDPQQLRDQIVAELRVRLRHQLDVVAEVPVASEVDVLTLHGEIVSWKAGNTATRMLVGFGAGRETADLAFRVTDPDGRTLFSRKDTIRTNFFAANGGAVSTGTLGGPFAQKIADRLKNANLRRQ